MKRSERTEASSAYQNPSVVFSDIHNYEDMNSNGLGRHGDNSMNRNNINENNDNYQQLSAVSAETQAYTELKNTARR